MIRQRVKALSIYLVQYFYFVSETNKNGEVEASRHQSKRGRGRKHQNQGGRGGQQEGRSHIPRKRLTLLEKVMRVIIILYNLSSKNYK